MSTMLRLTARVPRARSAKLDERLLDAGAMAVDVAPPDETEPEWLRLSVYLEAASLEAVRVCVHERFASLPSNERQRLTREVLVSDVDDSWQTRWCQGLEPVVLVPGLVLVPDGVAYEPKPDQRIMLLETGLVFGFGEHPTTRMIATWLATKARAATVLDVGCGTGVLAFVAAHHAARSVVGIDIDSASVAAARRNAERNGWHLLCTFTESPVEALGGDFDVVVANVDALTLERLASAISAKLVPGGALALTGVLEEQAEAVREAFVACDVHLRVRERSDDWVLLTNDP